MSGEGALPFPAQSRQAHTRTEPWGSPLHTGTEGGFGRQEPLCGEASTGYSSYPTRRGQAGRQAGRQAAALLGLPPPPTAVTSPSPVSRGGAPSDSAEEEPQPAPSSARSTLGAPLTQTPAPDGPRELPLWEGALPFPAQSRQAHTRTEPWGSPLHTGTEGGFGRQEPLCGEASTGYSSYPTRRGQAGRQAGRQAAALLGLPPPPTAVTSPSPVSRGGAPSDSAEEEPQPAPSSARSTLGAPLTQTPAPDGPRELPLSQSRQAHTRTEPWGSPLHTGTEGGFGRQEPLCGEASTGYSSYPTSLHTARPGSPGSETLPRGTAGALVTAANTKPSSLNTPPASWASSTRNTTPLTELAPGEGALPFPAQSRQAHTRTEPWGSPLHTGTEGGFGRQEPLCGEASTGYSSYPTRRGQAGRQAGSCSARPPPSPDCRDVTLSCEPGRSSLGLGRGRAAASSQLGAQHAPRPANPDPGPRRPARATALSAPLAASPQNGPVFHTSSLCCRGVRVRLPLPPVDSLHTARPGSPGSETLPRGTAGALVTAANTKPSSLNTPPASWASSTRNTTPLTELAPAQSRQAHTRTEPWGSPLHTGTEGGFGRQEPLCGEASTGYSSYPTSRGGAPSDSAEEEPQPAPSSARSTLGAPLTQTPAPDGPRELPLWEGALPFPAQSRQAHTRTEPWGSPLHTGTEGGFGRQEPLCGEASTGYSSYPTRRGQAGRQAGRQAAALLGLPPPPTAVTSPSPVSRGGAPSDSAEEEPQPAPSSARSTLGAPLTQTPAPDGPRELPLWEGALPFPAQSRQAHTRTEPWGSPLHTGTEGGFGRQEPLCGEASTGYSSYPTRRGQAGRQAGRQAAALLGLPPPPTAVTSPSPVSRGGAPSDSAEEEPQPAPSSARSTLGAPLTQTPAPDGPRELPLSQSRQAHTRTEPWGSPLHTGTEGGFGRQEPLCGEASTGYSSYPTSLHTARPGSPGSETLPRGTAGALVTAANTKPSSLNTPPASWASSTRNTTPLTELAPAQSRQAHTRTEPWGSPLHTGTEGGFGRQEPLCGEASTGYSSYPTSLHTARPGSPGSETLPRGTAGALVTAANTKPSSLNTPPASWASSTRNTTPLTELAPAQSRQAHTRTEPWGSPLHTGTEGGFGRQEPLCGEASTGYSSYPTSLHTARPGSPGSETLPRGTAGALVTAANTKPSSLNTPPASWASSTRNTTPLTELAPAQSRQAHTRTEPWGSPLHTGTEGGFGRQEPLCGEASTGYSSYPTSRGGAPSDSAEEEPQPAPSSARSTLGAPLTQTPAPDGPRELPLSQSRQAHTRTEPWGSPLHTGTEGGFGRQEPLCGEASTGYSSYPTSRGGAPSDSAEEEPQPAPSSARSTLGVPLTQTPAPDGPRELPLSQSRQAHTRTEPWGSPLHTGTEGGFGRQEPLCGEASTGYSSYPTSRGGAPSDSAEEEPQPAPSSARSTLGAPLTQTPAPDGPRELPLSQSRQAHTRTEPWGSPLHTGTEGGFGRQEPLCGEASTGYSSYPTSRGGAPSDSAEEEPQPAPSSVRSTLGVPLTQTPAPDGPRELPLSSPADAAPCLHLSDGTRRVQGRPGSRSGPGAVGSGAAEPGPAPSAARPQQNPAGPLSLQPSARGARLHRGSRLKPGPLARREACPSHPQRFHARPAPHRQPIESVRRLVQPMGREREEGSVPLGL
ncbi:collagen, type I, alpha 1b-like [Lepisosteus oculatus]|uniref:collagen, type I, alpha 1b-like n=1 Tax=Lepisosteus oculatus TaxID=7918 RepID=UPI0035F516F2